MSIRSEDQSTTVVMEEQPCSNDDNQIRHALKTIVLEHPALLRVRERLEKLDNALITNYSRMHHRHSRS